MKNQPNYFMIALMAAGVFLTPFRGHAAYNIYLSLSGVQGESTNSAYLNQIVVNSFSQGVTVSVGQGGTGKSVFTDMTITKNLDVSSPTLFYDCARGNRFTQAVLTFQDRPNNPTAFYTITLGSVLITGVQSGGSAGADSRPTETVTLNFNTISWSYQQLDSSGNAVGSPVVHSWNIATNSGG